MKGRGETIVIDATSIVKGGKGVSRYATNLVRHLVAAGFGYQFLILLDRAADLPELPSAGNVRYELVPARPLVVWRTILLPLFLRKHQHDLLHILDETAPLFFVKGLVITVHELPEIRFRLDPPESVYERISRAVQKAAFPRAMRKAARLVAVSGSTREDLVRLHAIPGERIHVSLEAAEECFFRKIGPKEKDEYQRSIGAGRGYVLSFATGDAREMNDLVISAWAEIVKSGMFKGKKLVLAGCRKDEVRRKLLRRIQDLGLSQDVIALGYVDESRMPLLYGAADLYADISRYEGFGLQVVEAMACGTPVVVSRLPVMEEVVGEAGILVDCEGPRSLADAIKGVLGNPACREDLASRACRRAREYSWDAVAQNTLGVYEAALDSRKSLS